MDGERAVLDLGGVHVERTPAAALNDLTVGAETAVVTGTDVLLFVGMPVDPAAQVRANIRKHHHFGRRFAQDENAVAVDRFFPSVDLAAVKVERVGVPTSKLSNFPKGIQVSVVPVLRAGSIR